MGGYPSYGGGGDPGIDWGPALVFWGLLALLVAGIILAPAVADFIERYRDAIIAALPYLLLLAGATVGAILVGYGRRIRRALRGRRHRPRRRRRYGRWFYRAWRPRRRRHRHRHHRH